MFKVDRGKKWSWKNQKSRYYEGKIPVSKQTTHRYILTYSRFKRRNNQYFWTFTGGGGGGVCGSGDAATVISAFSVPNCETLYRRTTSSHNTRLQHSLPKPKPTGLDLTWHVSKKLQLRTTRFCPVKFAHKHATCMWTDVLLTDERKEPYIPSQCYHDQYLTFPGVRVSVC